MKLNIDDKRIVALEIRRSCFGYAVFEGPKRLIDWGVTSPSPLNRATYRVQSRINWLLKHLPPVAVVVKVSRLEGHHSQILQLIKKEAESRLIPVHVVSLNELRHVFSIFSVRNNDDIAEVLTRIFPELLFRLPRKRRPWLKEARAMIVFGAISVGFAYWLQSATT
jgi:hypothetical protein